MTFDREQVAEQAAQVIHHHMKAVRDRGDYIVGPASNDAATAALAPIVRAVTDEIRALHQRDPSGAFCDHCWGGPTVRHIPSRGSAASEPRYPCPTVRLCDEIDQAAGVER